MRSWFIAVLVASTLTFAGDAGADDLFWYNDSGQVDIGIDSLKIIVRMTDTSKAAREALIPTFPRIVGYTDESTIDQFVVCSLSTGDGYWAFLDSLWDYATIELAEPYYLAAPGTRLMVGRGMCVAFETGVTLWQIDSLCSLYRIERDRSILEHHNLWVLNNTDSSGLRVVDLANEFHFLPEVQWAHPDFAIDIELHGYTLYDEYHFAQSNVKKIIGSFNEATVWDFGGFRENPTVVAVMDDGIAAHEDLPGSRILPGWDFGADPPDSNPSPSFYRNHGMACTGLIAASHDTVYSSKDDLDNTGMISLNPWAHILPVKIFPDGSNAVNTSTVAEAYDFARGNGADVISSCWGANPYIYDPIPTLNTALEDAFLYGRNGKGCPLIFSAGNDGYYDVSYPGFFDFCFAVGAVDDSDYLYSYSNAGYQMDVVAPSGRAVTSYGVLSLDQMGIRGRNPEVDTLTCIWLGVDQDYTCLFSGTSAAAPLVSGIASLLLARDSNLTAPQVYSIIRRSAVTHLDWGDIVPPDVLYAFGRADAFRAVLSIARGDMDNDGVVTLGDMAVLSDILFISLNPAYPDPLLADCNCDGSVDLADMTQMIDHLFISLDPLPIPCYEYGE